MLKHVLFWVAIGAIVGLLSGSASALFLLSLDWVSEIRDAHLWLLALLPLAGFGIGYGLDWLFGTLPIFLILFIGLGFVAGVRTMMRTAQEVQNMHMAQAADEKEG